MLLPPAEASRPAITAASSSENDTLSEISLMKGESRLMRNTSPDCSTLNKADSLKVRMYLYTVRRLMPNRRATCSTLSEMLPASMDISFSWRLNFSSSIATKLRFSGLTADFLRIFCYFSAQITETT